MTVVGDDGIDSAGQRSGHELIIVRVLRHDPGCCHRLDHLGLIEKSSEEVAEVPAPHGTAHDVLVLALERRADDGLYFPSQASLQDAPARRPPGISRCDKCIRVEHDPGHGIISF
jgi:hypothetical protein